MIGIVVTTGIADAVSRPSAGRFALVGGRPRLRAAEVAVDVDHAGKVPVGGNGTWNLHAPRVLDPALGVCLRNRGGFAVGALRPCFVWLMAARLQGLILVGEQVVVR